MNRNDTLTEAARTSLDAGKVLLRSHEAMVVEDPSVLAIQAVALELHALTLTVEAALLPPEPRSDAPPEVKEGWYHVELMGHRERWGHVRPVTLAGRPLVEIATPSYPKGEPKHAGDDDPEMVASLTEFYSPAAIFSLSPSTERAVMDELIERARYPF